MAAQFKNFLVSTIGFANDAEAQRVRATGLDGFAALPEYSKEDIQSLVRTLKKDATAPMTIGPIVEKRLKQAACLSKHYQWFNRTLTATNLSKTRLHSHGQFMELIDKINDKETPALEKVGQKYAISKLMEDFPLYLKTQIGVRGVPLSYVIRDTDAPVPLEGLAANQPYSTVNGSFHNELIAHMPHDGIGWDEDNAEVFSLLLSVLQTSSYLTSLKGYQKTGNGREAWKNLVLHNLGNSVWDNRTTAAEDKVLNKIFDGRNHRYSLLTHCNHHRDAHQEMVRANEAVGFQIPDARTRVTRLLKSIQTSHTPLQSAKVTIENDPLKRGDFEEAVDFLCKFKPPTKSSNHGGLHRISSTTTDMKNDLDKLKDVNVDIRFYKPDEWRNLTNDQRKKCILTRRLQNKEGGDYGSGNGGGKRKFSFDKQTKRWKKKIEKQGRIIASLKAEKKETPSNSNTSNDGNNDSSEPKVQFNKGVAQRSKKD